MSIGRYYLSQFVISYKTIFKFFPFSYPISIWEFTEIDTDGFFRDYPPLFFHAIQNIISIKNIVPFSRVGSDSHKCSFYIEFVDCPIINWSEDWNYSSNELFLPSWLLIFPYKSTTFDLSNPKYLRCRS